MSEQENSGEAGAEQFDRSSDGDGHQRGSQPIFNTPTVVLVSLAVLIIIHTIRVFVLSADSDYWLLATFAFVPIRYALIGGGGFEALPGGVFGDVWTFFSYTFLHGDWGHVMTNGLWMLVFGTPLARRFGAVRFLIFSLIGSVGGAMLHLVTNFGDPVPMIGASAAVSAQTAALLRFAFEPMAPLGNPRSTHPMAAYLPATPLLKVFEHKNALAFALVWFAINLGYALLGSSEILGGAIAWQAHIGGFITGLVLFSIFDPVKTRQLNR